jgi:hypothetical protein
MWRTVAGIRDVSECPDADAVATLNQVRSAGQIFEKGSAGSDGTLPCA